jgi:hypothetical protein
MPSDTKRILLTGATGYIGGSVLAALLDSADPVLQSSPITCLLRGADRAVTLSFTYGDRVKPILCRDLDDVKPATTIAAQHDIVIHCTLGYHPASALALVRGLTQRRAATGREVWIIHTSGTSDVQDNPITHLEAPVCDSAQCEGRGGRPWSVATHKRGGFVMRKDCMLEDVARKGIAHYCWLLLLCASLARRWSHAGQELQFGAAATPALLLRSTSSGRGILSDMVFRFESAQLDQINRTR